MQDTFTNSAARLTEKRTSPDWGVFIGVKKDESGYNK